MPQPTPEELLTRQFHEWEERGRGWLSAELPVALEPPFRPFGRHHVPFVPRPDDGRRPSLFSRLAEAFSERSPVTQLPVPEEPAPRPLARDSEVRVFSLAIPREEKTGADATGAFLLSLRGTRYPTSFEVIGTEEGVALQIAVREEDEQFFLSSLRSYFPGTVASPTNDVIARVIEEYPDAPHIVLHLGYAREFMLPFAADGRLEPDPLVGFVGALDDVPEGELAALQILFEPAREPWAENIYRAVTTDGGEDFFHDGPEFTRAAKRKATEPLFAVTLRLVFVLDDPAHLDVRFRRLALALGQFETTEGNGFIFLNEDQSDHPVYARDVLRRQSHWTGMLWSLSELQSLVHLPGPSVTTPRLLARTARRTAPVQDGSQGLYLGVNRHAGEERPVYLTLDRARRHVHVVGASGSGKSNLLLQLLLEDVKQGGGIALLDPHGDLVDDLLVRIPEKRLKDVILLDPADTEYPVGFNVLAAHSDLEKTLLASDLVAIFRRLSTSWGDQMHAVLANGIQAFLESGRGGTIADLRKFLVDREFREEFLTTIRDEEIVYYWRKEFPLLKGRPQGPILTRLDSFLRPKLVRQMVTQRENRIDFRAVMDTGKIFLAKLAQGAIGEENAALLGSFLIARFHQTAMSRQDTEASKRRPFLIAADECQHFVTPSMASILAGARKYSVGLVLAHQDLAQLQRRDAEVFSSLSANAGTRIVFRVGDADARALGDGFAHFTSEDLRALPTGEAICRYDRADHDFNLAVPLVEAVDERKRAERRARIIEFTRRTYGAPRPEAEETRREETDTDERARPAPPDGGETRQPPPTEPLGDEATAAVKAPEAARPVKRELPEEVSLGRGGPQHKYLQELVKRFGEAQGYRATIEKPTPGGGSVDVALERADGSIAVEISVTSTFAYESGNVSKCLAAGYARVVILAPERRRLDGIAKAVRSVLPDSERSRVEFLLPEEFLTFLTSQTAPAASEDQVGGYKVKVSYKKPPASDAKERQRAVAEVVARSVRKLDK
jgi:hypothetical protein